MWSEGGVKVFEEMESFEQYLQGVDIFLFPGGIPLYAKPQMLGTLEYLEKIKARIESGSAMVLAAQSGGLIFLGANLETTVEQLDNRDPGRRDRQLKYLVPDLDERYFENDSSHGLYASPDHDVDSSHNLHSLSNSTRNFRLSEEQRRRLASNVEGMRLFPRLTFRPHMTKMDFETLQKSLLESPRNSIRAWEEVDQDVFPQKSNSELVEYQILGKSNGTLGHPTDVVVLRDYDILTTKGDGVFELFRPKVGKEYEREEGYANNEDTDEERLWFVGVGGMRKLFVPRQEQLIL